MLMSILANAASWVPTVQQTFNEFVFKILPALDTNINWLAIISGFVFFFFVVWALWDSAKHVEEAENQRPSITVKPVLFDDIWYLEVTNNCEKGVFTAQVSVFNKPDLDPKYQEIGPKYHALWGNSNTNESIIFNGQTDIIRLAAITYTNDNKYFEIRGYDTVKKSPYSIRRIEYDDFKKFANEQIVQVIISASPRLKEGAFVKEYNISLRGMTESAAKKRLSAPDSYMFGERDDKETILTRLSQFIPDGEAIRDKCYNQKTKVPEQEATDWAEEVAKYLDTLGNHYRPSFFNSEGLGTAKIPPMYSSEHQRVALFISYRLMRIQQYLEELRGK